MTKNVTIKDIAREAGVSIALVSFVMNNRIEANGKKRYRVSESTKQKILEVAKRMNYRPSSAARMLRKGRTHVIGILLSDLANIFYGILAKEFERICYQNGFTVLFGSTEEDPERFDRLVQSFLEKDVEGFILVPCVGSGKTITRIIESGRPFVTIDRYHPDYHVPSVFIDNIGIMRKAVEALIQQGGQRLGLVSYDLRISTMIEREEGFREIAGNDAPIYLVNSDNMERDAEKATEDILERKLDGIVTASNVISVSMIKALRKKGVKIQEDVRIVSFDFSNVYDLFTPAITYVQQPLPQIAQESAEYLFRLIDMKNRGEDISNIKDNIILKASLI